MDQNTGAAVRAANAAADVNRNLAPDQTRMPGGAMVVAFGMVALVSMVFGFVLGLLF